MTAESPVLDVPRHEALKPQAQAWFAHLRDQICAAFEAIEDEYSGSDLPAGRFERTAWSRESGGGGVTSVMRGRVR
jgi:coproporphyrinogen III oxidase